MRFQVTKHLSGYLNIQYSTESIEDRGLKPINDIMDSMGGWPAVKGDNWDEKSWTWQKSILDCRKKGYSNDYLIDFSVGTDLKNSSTKIVDVRNLKCVDF